MPLKFWSQVMVTLDKKISTLADNSGYGSVNLEVIVKRGDVQDVIFSDRVQIRQTKENLTNKD